MDEPTIIKNLIRSGQLPTPEKVQTISKNQIQIKKAKIETNDTYVEILTKNSLTPKKIEVKDFTSYFRGRHNYLKNLLVNRPELNNTTSIARLSPKTKATIIGSVLDIRKLPTGTVKLVVEDFTGQTTAIISSKNKEAIAKAQQLSLDAILAFKGSAAKGVFFVDDIVWPDVQNKSRARTPQEVYLACISDFHVGSKMFLPKLFDKFLKWINGRYGNLSQRAIASKTKYLVMVGDVVDGVGVYPSQEKELEITDVYKQYDVAAKLFSQIPEDKQVIVIPGNHDAVRLCEPQPPLYKDLAEGIYELPNVHLAPNPAQVLVHKQEDFQGVNLLLYHGYSFDHFIEHVASLRMAGGYDAIDKLWEFLFKHRHLAPTYGSTLALPSDQDPLLIKQVPDIAVSGHTHKSKVGSYKGILTISASCFQATTSFQQKIGHSPNPGYVPIVNLHTGRAWQLRFSH